MGRKSIDMDIVLVYYIINTKVQSKYGGEKMKFDDKLPIYTQIVDYLKRKIINGKLKEGEKLPSVREIAKSLKVNPNTVQRSYQILEYEDIIFTQRGRGSFVTEDKEKIEELKLTMANEIVNNFINDMKNLGFERNEVIELIKAVKEEK